MGMANRYGFWVNLYAKNEKPGSELVQKPVIVKVVRCLG